MSVVPEATGPRDVKESVAYIRCPVLESPPAPCSAPPFSAAWSLPVATTAAFRRCRGSLQNPGPVYRKPRGPPASGLWCFTQNSCRSPCRGRGLPGAIFQWRQPGGGRRATLLWCRAQRSPLLATQVSLGRLGSLFRVHFLGEPGGGPVPSALPSFVPRPLLLTPPGRPCLVAANTGGGDPDCRVLLTSPHVGNQTF